MREKNTHQERLQVEMMAVSELIPYVGNSRTHSEEQINLIAESIQLFGFTNPVLIHKSGKIIAGHGRVLAALKINRKEIPVIKLNYLDDVQAKALVIVDNQLANLAGWNFDVLAAEIDALNDEGFNLDLLGFTKEQLDELIGSPDEIWQNADQTGENADKEGKNADKEDEKRQSDTVFCPKCHHEFVL